MFGACFGHAYSMRGARLMHVWGDACVEHVQNTLGARASHARRMHVGHFRSTLGARLGHV
eukprot:10236376-Lingulodinium_polyedra.AAC.1